MKVFGRSLLPPDEIVPNSNDPAMVPPSTVGPDQLVSPGDAHGVEVAGDATPAWVPPRIVASGWSGWPAEWWPPAWDGHMTQLTDMAWLCLDKNSKALATMPPYLVNAAPSLNASWLVNPQPEIYTSWEEFAKQLFWDFQLGEVFVVATSYYADGRPAQFHVVPPWTVEVTMVEGRRRYTIGAADVSEDMLHIRYKSTVDCAHGTGPLEAGWYRMVAAQTLARYGTSLAVNGGIPAGVLKSSVQVGAEGAAKAKANWMAARAAGVGEPAFLDAGLTWEPTQVNAEEMALVPLLQMNEGRIAELLGVPPELVGLPSQAGTMTYKNMSDIFEYHWRDGLRPMAQIAMAALSGWALRGQTRVELNRDAYIRPGPLERAQTAQILFGIVDPVTGQRALTVDEIRQAERLDDTTPTNVAQGVLRG
jgi:HK97 family phage portal protein